MSGQIQILEEHDEALWYIKKAYEKNLRPKTLIHVDAHSDMELREFFDLGSYILKAVYWGYVDECVWVKRPFCSEFREGTYRFTIGNNEAGDLLCSLDHPMFRKNYSEEDGITHNARNLVFHVTDLANAAKVGLEMVGNEIIFDLDLDFFGAKNIFEDVLIRHIGEEGYFGLRRDILGNFRSIAEIDALERVYLESGRGNILRWANIFPGGFVFPNFWLDEENIKNDLKALKKVLTFWPPSYILMCKSQSSGYLNVENPEDFFGKIQNFLKLWKTKNSI